MDAAEGAVGRGGVQVQVFGHHAFEQLVDCRGDRVGAAQLLALELFEGPVHGLIVVVGHGSLQGEAVAVTRTPTCMTRYYQRRSAAIFFPRTLPSQPSAGRFPRRQWGACSQLPIRRVALARRPRPSTWPRRWRPPRRRSWWSTWTLKETPAPASVTRAAAPPKGRSTTSCWATARWRT